MEKQRRRWFCGVRWVKCEGEASVQQEVVGSVVEKQVEECFGLEGSGQQRP